jgi:hypothetical protein
MHGGAGKKSQFGFLFRNPSKWLYARNCLELVDKQRWLEIEGNVATSVIEKELTEAYSVLCRLPLQEREDELETCFFDCCSGKGWLSLLLRECRPRGEVVAIDKGFRGFSEAHTRMVRKRGVALLALDLLNNGGARWLDLHVQARLRGVSTESAMRRDNFSDSARASRLAFEEEMRSLEVSVSNSPPRRKRAVFVSVHPCGSLASTIVSCFVRNSQSRDVCVLMPCCSPGDTARTGYAQVCEDLYNSVPEEGFTRRLETDTECKSDKNCVLTFERL